MQIQRNGACLVLSGVLALQLVLLCPSCPSLALPNPQARAVRTTYPFRVTGRPFVFRALPFLSRAVYPTSEEVTPPLLPSRLLAQGHWADKT